MTPDHPTLLGILNITEDSFSDGGRYLDPEAAKARATELAGGRAHIIDLGAASSKPAAAPVPAEVEIARLAPVVALLKALGKPISIDSFSPAVHRWALEQGVDWLNDVRGFPEPALYPELAASQAGLIVVHTVDGLGPAPRIHVPPETILDRVTRFFEARLEVLTGAGVASERIVVDPGMGFFLGTATESSLRVLRSIETLKARFGRPVLISVSRKYFLRRLAGVEVSEAGPASLTAELFAASRGADMIRTHEPDALAGALTVWKALAGPREDD